MSLWPTSTHPVWVALTDADLVVTNDPSKVSPPCVLLLPATASGNALCGPQIATYEITAISPGPAHAESMKWLWENAAPTMLTMCDEVQAGSLNLAGNDYPVLRGETIRQGT